MAGYFGLLVVVLVVSLSPGRITGQVLRDTDGDLLVNGADYLVLLKTPGLDGVLTRASKTNDDSCPQFVIRSPDPGTPVKLGQAHEDGSFPMGGIPVPGLGLNIGFGPGPCSPQGLWRLLPIPNPVTGLTEVSADGFDQERSSFRIIPGGPDVYMILSDFEDEAGQFRTLSVVTDDTSGLEVLALSPPGVPPVQVAFQKAN